MFVFSVASDVVIIRFQGVFFVAVANVLFVLEPDVVELIFYAVIPVAVLNVVLIALFFFHSILANPFCYKSGIRIPAFIVCAFLRFYTMNFYHL